MVIDARLLILADEAELTATEYAALYGIELHKIEEQTICELPGSDECE